MSTLPTCLPIAWTVAITAWEAWAMGPGEQAETTIYTRRQHLQRLARTIGVTDPYVVSGAQLRAWFIAQRWATETKRGVRTTLRGFYLWALLDGRLPEPVSPALMLPRVRPARPNPKPAPETVYRPTLLCAEPRERLMLRMAHDHGMRRGEIAVMHSDDLMPDLVGWTLRVHGKGGRERLVPLLDEVARALLALPPGWVFPGDVDGHLSPRWVGKLVNRLLPDFWTIHKLRHSAAVNVHEASGGDITVTQDFLGHASPTTTRHYLPTNMAKIRAAVNDAARAA